MNDPTPQLSDLSQGRGPLEQRVLAGKAMRQLYARKNHATLAPIDDKRDPIALLEASNKGRLRRLIQVRYGWMLASPFAFYRGAAPIMAYDLGQLPHSGITVQLCGDCHLMNFGLFASPERRLLFDINDFDETLPGPFEWDLKRLATSFVIAGQGRSFAEADCREAVRVLTATYREKLIEFSEMNTLDVWYYQLTADILVKQAKSRAALTKRQGMIERAQSRSAASMLDQATEEVQDFERGVRDFILTYRNTLPADRRALFDLYRLVDVAIKVVGVGSVGTRCAVGLFVADGKYPLFLQFKEASASVLEPYLGNSCYSKDGYHGERVVIGQRLVQPASDIFLGWSHFKQFDCDFYVRQLRDMKASVKIEQMEPQDLIDYAQACGWAVHEQAKSGDPALLRGYVGKADVFDRALEDFAVAYAERNTADWEALRSAVEAGKIKAVIETPS